MTRTVADLPRRPRANRTPRSPYQQTRADILAEVAREHRVSVAQILDRCRLATYVIPRQEAMWRMVEARRWSLPAIGQTLGRDHTTVLHGWRRHAERLAAASKQQEAA